MLRSGILSRIVIRESDLAVSRGCQILPIAGADSPVFTFPALNEINPNTTTRRDMVAGCTS